MHWLIKTNVDDEPPKRIKIGNDEKKKEHTGRYLNQRQWWLSSSGRLQPTPDLGSTQPLVWLGEEGEMWHWGGPQRAVEVTGLPKTYLREWGRACVPSYTSWARSLGIANHSSATAITSFVIPYFMCYFSCISSHDLSYLSSLPRSFFLIALGCKNQRFRK